MQANRLSRVEQARRGFDPNAGMVHLVNASSSLLHTDDHVIKDLYEDSNKGVTHLLSKRTGLSKGEGPLPGHESQRARSHPQAADAA